MKRTFTPPPAIPSSDRAGDALLWLGAILTLIPQLLRATSNLTTFPAWDLDPLLYSLPLPAITPAGSLLIDALTLIGASLLLLRALRQGTPLNLSLTLLTCIGAAAILFHGWLNSDALNSLGHQRTGASWLSAMFAALALWHAAQGEHGLRVRRIFTGTLLGFIALIAIYGIVQVYFTHAATLADFNADPDRFLAAHGWSRDSSMAKAFIRRMSQPEASGWFGLANVYASFAAAGVVCGMGLLAHALRSRTSPSDPSTPPFLIILSLSLFTVLSAIALFLAHSKGGYLAAAAALASILFLAFVVRRPSPTFRRLAALLGIAAILGPIALIFTRGLLADHSHELSLYFRSFYAHASARIFLSHPVVGVGPDGFQCAFLLAKPPLCPEEVTSPHCIPLDWLADLGTLGLAWLLILFRLSIHATTSPLLPSSPLPTAHSPLPRSDLRLILLLPALATILAAFLESPFITIDLAAVRILGLAAWCIASFAIASVLSSSLSSRLALAGAAIALIAHAQIDVTASFVSSTALWAMLIALAAAPHPVPPTAAPGSRCESTLFSRSTLTLAILPPILLSALLIYTALARTLPWERKLAEAATTVRPVAEFSERLAALPHAAHVPPNPTTTPPDSLDRIVRDLAQALNHPVQPNESSFTKSIHELEARLLPESAAALEQAHAILPDDWRPLREASRLQLQLAEAAHRAGFPDSARERFARAESVLHLDQTTRPHLSSEWHWLATLLEHRADLLSEPDSRSRAVHAREQVAALDPYNLDNALRLFQDFEKLHDQPNARTWAAKALELHDFTRLDRETRGLPPPDLADVQNALKPLP